MSDRPIATDDLIRRLPLPLAQLYRRAHNAKTPRDRRDFAYYMWESALKLLASTALVTYADDPTDANVNAKLPDLTAPSLGHWRDLILLLAPVLAQRGDQAFTKIQALLSKKSDDLPRCAHLSATISRTLNQPGAGRTTVNVAELFKLLVEYRNKEFGHGAPASRSDDAIGEQAEALSSAAVELFDRLNVLAGRRLIAITDVSLTGGIGRAARIDLIGLNPWQIDAIEWPLAAPRPPDVGVYLADPNNPNGLAALRSLHPLVAFDSAAETVLLFNGRSGRNHALHLCYVTNRMPKQNLAGTVHSALLARMLDVAVAATEMEPVTSGGPTAKDADEAIGPRFLGDYELTRELGRGAMGVVYEAWQPVLRRRVALKEQPRSHDPAADKRFLREISALGRVEHPNLIKVFASGTESGSLYYTMELIDGAPLSTVSDALTRDGATTVVDLPRWQDAIRTALQVPKPAEELPARLKSLPTDGDYIRRMVDLLRQSAASVSALHEAGILHRDIKPGNIMVTADGLHAVVMDLGTARLMNEPSTLTKHFLGTLRYASLEQIRGQTLDGRSDVYSLGATLWELLALQPIFQVSDQTPTPDLIQKLETEEPQRLSRINSAVGRDLEAVVHKCLEKSLGRRYGTAKELADDLQRVLDGEPVTARPVGALDRAAKWVLRHPTKTAAWSMSAAAILLLAVAAVISSLWIDADRAQRTAVKERDASNLARGEANEANRKLDAANDMLGRIGYAERIQLAQAKWSAGDQVLAVQLLDQCKPELGKPDFRGWEWMHLNRSWRPILHTLAGHTAEAFHVAFSLDGARLASGSGDKTVRLWDVATGQQLATLTGHTDYVWDVAFSPDGSRLASASNDKTVQLWDVAKRKLLATLAGHTDCVWHVTFSPDGSRLASASADRTARLWDAVTGKELATLAGHTESVNFVAFSPDGSRLVSASNDKTVQIWDATTGKSLITLAGHASYVWRVAFSPDGSQLASSSKDKTVRLWDAATGKPSATLDGHTDSVVHVVFSPDGARLASAGEDTTVRLWNAATGISVATLAGHTASVSRVVFSPDGSRLASASDDKTVRLWDAVTGKPLAALAGHTDCVRHVAFSPDGTRLASASSDNSVRLWDATMSQTPTTLSGHGDNVRHVTFSPKGERLASASDDKSVRLWDAATGKPLATLKGHADYVWHVAFSPDGSQLASASDDRTVRLWDAITGMPLATLVGHADPVLRVAFSPDGTRLASASNDTTVRLWGAVSGNELATLMGHTAKVNFVAFSSDGSRLASASSDKTVRLWDSATGIQLATLAGHTDVVSHVAFSPDGSRLASASFDKTVRLWNTATGSPLATLSGHTGYAEHVVFSPEGARLASASLDKTIRLWDVPTGRELVTLAGHGEWVPHVIFSPDGSRLASASFDKTVRLWDVATGKPLATLAGHAAVVRQVAFSPDGSRLASANDDHSVRLWIGIESEADREKRRRYWRDQQAEEAEKNQSWFAARFHLDQLLKLEPNNTDYRKRRDHADALGGKEK